MQRDVERVVGGRAFPLDPDVGGDRWGLPNSTSA